MLLGYSSQGRDTSCPRASPRASILGLLAFVAPRLQAGILGSTPQKNVIPNGVREVRNPSSIDPSPPQKNPSSTPYLRLLRSSTNKHASSTTTNPPARALSAAPKLKIPCCIHKTFAFTAAAASAISGKNSARRKTSTISIPTDTSSNRAYAFSPNTSVSFGFTGIIVYPTPFNKTPPHTKVAAHQTKAPPLQYSSNRAATRPQDLQLG